MRSKLEIRNLIITLIIGLLAINCAFMLAFYFSFNDPFTDREVNSEASYRTLLIIANLLYVVIGLRPAAKIKKEFRDYSLFLISYMAVIIFLRGYEFSRAFHIYFLGTLFIFTLLWRYSNVIEFIQKYFLPYTLIKKVILIGEEFDPSIIQYINSRPGNYKCVGLLSSSLMSIRLQERSAFDGVFHRHIDDLESILKNSSVDEVLISTSRLSAKEIDAIMSITETYHTTTCVLPPYFKFLSKQNCQTEYWMGIPIISVFHTKLSISYYQFAKRCLDIIFSIFFLLAVFPILCFIVAPAIWLSSRGPIFFKQLRKGYKQEPFFCYKFRTMKTCNKSEEVVQAKKADPRVTLIGKTMRKTSIDEVPQFLNVLRGNMSIVGPRPHMVEHDEMYEKFISLYNVRFATKPGITGWAQINGYRGGTEDSRLMQERINHDLWYIKNWSIWLDVKIIFLTMVRLLNGDKNAY